MPAEVREVIDLTLWDSFVDDSPQGTIFCKSAWLSLYDRPHKIYGYFKGSNLMGGICGFEYAGDIFDSGCRVPLTPFQGVLVKSMPGAKPQAIESMHHEVANALIPYLKHAHVGIGNHYTFPDIRPFLWAGYQPIVRYTYIVSLLDMGKLWEGLEKQTRYEINQDMNEVKPVTLEEFDKLYTLTFQRKGLERPLTTEFVKNLAETFPYILTGNDHSMIYMIRDNKRAYYILGASDGSGSAKALWHGLTNLFYAGVKEVDFVGCNSKDIGHFKRGFGGRLQPYFCVARI